MEDKQIKASLKATDDVAKNRQNALGYCTRFKQATTESIGSLHEEEVLAHIRWMCYTAYSFIEFNQDTRKAERWLCFAQGVLWSFGVSSIDEFRKNNCS